jgi:hypothetical protein
VLPGVIVTSGPVGDGLADAGALVFAPGEAVLPAAGRTTVVVLTVQAVSTIPSTATQATRETVLIRLMSPPFPATYATPQLSFFV